MVEHHATTLAGVASASAERETREAHDERLCAFGERRMYELGVDDGARTCPCAHQGDEDVNQLARVSIYAEREAHLRG